MIFFYIWSAIVCVDSNNDEKLEVASFKAFFSDFSQTSDPILLYLLYLFSILFHFKLLIHKINSTKLNTTKRKFH